MNGGPRPGAGRPKNNEIDPDETEDGESPRGLTRAEERKLPLEYMLDVMNDPTADKARRDRMAAYAAPYLHPKAGEQGKKEGRADAAQKAATGKYAPAAAPAGTPKH